METLLWLALATANVLTLNVFAAPHQGTGSAASVLIGIEVEGAGPRGVELHYDITGGPAPIPPRTVTLAESAGTARALTRHALPPGTYRLRLTATDMATGGAAAVAR